MNTRSMKPEAWFVDPETIGTPAFQNRADILFKTAGAMGANGRSAGTSHLTGEPSAPRFGPPGGKAPAAIFVPTDFTAETEAAVKLGITLARRSGGHLVLFHSVYLNLTPYGPANPKWLTEALQREAMEKAEPMVNSARAAGVSVTAVVEEGSPVQTILKSAAKWNASTIVLTTQRRGWFSRLFRGRTVERVVQGAKCPVMVLRRGRKK
jgi:nucleotide-binding universal stress UspA family protein